MNQTDLLILELVCKICVYSVILPKHYTVKKGYYLFEITDAGSEIKVQRACLRFVSHYVEFLNDDMLV